MGSRSGVSMVTFHINIEEGVIIAVAVFLQELHTIFSFIYKS